MHDVKAVRAETTATLVVIAANVRRVAVSDALLNPLQASRLLQCLELTRLLALLLDLNLFARSRSLRLRFSRL